MTTGLSDYQIAVLQAMNIPVFQRQDAQKVTQSAEQVARPVPADKPKRTPVSKSDAQSRLASLKAAMSSEGKADKNQTTAAVSVTNSAPAKQPVGEQFSAFTDDVSNALASLKLNEKAAVWIGKELSVNQQELVLPAQPDKLTAEHKRALWQALVALSTS